MNVFVMMEIHVTGYIVIIAQWLASEVVSDVRGVSLIAGGVFLSINSIVVGRFRVVGRTPARSLSSEMPITPVTEVGSIAARELQPPVRTLVQIVLVQIVARGSVRPRPPRAPIAWIAGVGLAAARELISATTTAMSPIAFVRIWEFVIFGVGSTDIVVIVVFGHVVFACTALIERLGVWEARALENRGNGGLSGQERKALGRWEKFS